MIERPPHPSTDLFNSFLQNYQEDIRRIIGKFRYKNHYLDIDEIASRANLMLLKKRDDILYDFEGDFNKTSFSKLAYTYVRNIIGWSQTRESQDKYRKNRLDAIHVTEDGAKTSFDFAIELEGYEDSGFEAFDSTEKYATLLKIIKEYCHILTDGEIKILSCLEHGMGHYEIADKFKITHQAVSHAAIKVFAKIQAYFSKNVLSDDLSSNVSKGNKAINDFFTSKNHSAMTESERHALRSFLLSNIQSYTIPQVSKKFMNGKFNKYQINSFCNRNRLNFCIVKSQRPTKYTPEDTQKIADLYNQGKTTPQIAKIMGVPPRSMSAKKGHLIRMGLLNETVG